MISNCGHDEHGGISGGQAGDQGGEYKVIPWYSRPWSCTLRHPNKEFSELVANMAIAAAENDCIGYDQGQRTTFWTELEKVQYDPAAITTPCETDCSASTCSIIKGAAHRLKLTDMSTLPITSTYYMREQLKRRGYTCFIDSQHTSGDAYNERGDILLLDSAHVAIEVGDGKLNGYSSSGGLGSTSFGLTNFNISATSPYIVTVPDTCTYFDAEAMKQKQIMGVMLSAGYLYSPGHIEMPNYVNTNLRKQTEICKEAEIPWALCAEVRAHTVAEAEAECKRLYYVVAAFPPRMSLWLHLDMHQTKDQNERILDYYHEQICKWGFRDLCGIYVDAQELKQISWPNFQDKFYLWYSDHTLNLKDWVDQILNPARFAIDYVGRTTPLPSIEDIVTSVTNTASNIVNTLTGNDEVSADGNKVVERAKAEMGKPYVWGAVGPSSYDCSGLVGYCLTGKHKRLGTSYTYMSWPKTASPQPGDVCTNDHHCGIYIGNGKMIHAPHSGDVVKVGPVQSGMIYVKYRG